MVFSSALFIYIFLPITLFCYFVPSLILRRELIAWKNFCLIVFSLLFYSWGEGINVLIMLGLVVINWIAARAISNPTLYRKAIFISSLLLTISPLFYFKYTNFFFENLNYWFNLNLKFEKKNLPIGISFFTFQLISYLADVYLNQVKAQKSFAKLLLYISFFPQLIAGPIVRYVDVSSEIRSRVHSIRNFSYGSQRFIIGLAQKLIIANSLGELADKIYQTPMSANSSSLLWIAAISYSFQIYFDFSGYSNMGIGMARMFGFNFLENFNFPYSALSITDFWRRWHISLSSWFRDYVYIPLGGNRSGRLRTYFNLSIVFLLCGLWHGASWNFVIWGALHGTLLIFEKTALGKIFLGAYRPILFIYTFFTITCLWVFFRIETLPKALEILHVMFQFRHSENALLIREVVSPELFIISIIALIFSIDLKYIFSKQKLSKHPAVCESKDATLIGTLGLISIFLISLGYLAGSDFNPFIYYRF